VAEDVQTLVRRGFQQVSFSLDLASFDRDWWQALFDALYQQSVRIGFYNEFFQLPSEDFVKWFVITANLAHTEVAVSPLSGDERVRRRNGKSYSNEQLLDTLKLFKQYRIPVFVYFSLNLPGETPETLERTIALADQIGQLYPSGLLRMLNTCHTVDPASPMSENPASYGVQVGYHAFQDYYVYCRGTGWQPRLVTRGEHRGFEVLDRPAQVVEQMAERWDRFASDQAFNCAPVPRGW
jgi:hypothetical protein